MNNFYAVPTLTKLLNIQQSHFKLLLFDINHLKGNKKKKKSSSSVLENHVRVKNAKGGLELQIKTKKRQKEKEENQRDNLIQGAGYEWHDFPIGNHT